MRIPRPGCAVSRPAALGFIGFGLLGPRRSDGCAEAGSIGVAHRCVPGRDGAGSTCHDSLPTL